MLKLALEGNLPELHEETPEALATCCRCRGWSFRSLWLISESPIEACVDEKGRTRCGSAFLHLRLSMGQTARLPPTKFMMMEIKAKRSSR